MKMVEDSSLTVHQQALKWYLYLEVDLEDDADIKAALRSMLHDLEAEG